MPTWMAVLLQVVVVLGIIAYGIFLWYRNFKRKIMSANKSNTSKTQSDTYIVRTLYGERELKFFDMRTDYDDKSPFYGIKYNYFKDNIGHFWRSYDGNKNVIEENGNNCIDWENILK